MASFVENVNKVAELIPAKSVDLGVVVDNINNINSLAPVIADLQSIVDDVVPNIAEILLADTNAQIATTQAGEASASASKALGYRNEALGFRNEAEAFNESKAFVVDTVEDLLTIPSSYVTATVRDLDRGGTFIYDATKVSESNGGTNFSGWVRQYNGAVNVKWFGAKGDGVTDDTLAIQNALNSGLNVFIPGGIYKTTSPLEIPVLTSFYGEDNKTVIKPTYSSWVGTDHRAIVLETKEGVNYHNRDFGKRISNFSIEGVDSHLVKAIALDFSTKNPNSVIGSTVNWSLYNTNISNISISRFDTALNIFELWAASFTSIFINECREAIHIEGQSVNNMFSHIQATNFTNNYTSSADNTIGIYVNFSDRYNGVPHRPEGFCFDSCLVFGAYNNVYIRSCLAFKMDKMILDGGSNVCVNLVNPADFTLSNSYIYSAHTVLIAFSALGSLEVQPVKILNNNIYGTGLETTGILFIDGGTSRQGITISGNSFTGCGRGISAIMCPIYSHITNNTFYGLLKYTTKHIMIYIQNNGHGTVIDGNNANINATILWCHPTVTDPTLKIGTNTSLIGTTKYSGKVTIPAGSTSVIVPVWWADKEDGIRFILSITCDQYTPYKYVPNTSWMNGTITIPTALDTNATFMYTTTAVPYRAAAKF